MPRWQERLYLRRLVADAEEAVSFFSSRRKPERERAVSRAFLRCIGVNFSVDEITSIKDEPPDVSFRDARFEVTEILDETRLRHDEWKEEKDRRARAKKLANLREPYSPPEAVPYASLLERISAALGEKSRHYGGPKGCAKIDALVYVDLKNKTLDPASPIPSLDALSAQGWRSVSILIPPYGIVLYAGNSSPEFLRAVANHPRSEWLNMTSALFD